VGSGEGPEKEWIVLTEYEREPEMTPSERFDNLAIACIKKASEFEAFGGH
jgi:hypothetical protein